MKRKQNMTTEEWRDLAIGTNERGNDGYLRPHGTFSTDGFRAHVDETLKPCGCEFCNRVESVLSSKHNSHQFTITTSALVTAARQALAIGRDHWRPQYDFIPSLVIKANGRMEYFAECNGNGTVSGSFGNGDETRIKPRRKKHGKGKSSYKITVTHETVKYSHEGEDTEFAINPNFLLDALSGMGVTVTISGWLNWPVVITDPANPTRKAIVMPKAL